MTKYNHNKDSYQVAAKKVFSLSAMCRELGILAVGSNYRTVKKNLEAFGIDALHFTGQGHNLGKRKDQPLGKTAIKNKLIKERGYKCEECNRKSHRGQPIVLEMEHIVLNKVRDGGLEPPRYKAIDSNSTSATNYDNPACFVI